MLCTCTYEFLGKSRVCINRISPSNALIRLHIVVKNYKKFDESTVPVARIAVVYPVADVASSGVKIISPIYAAVFSLLTYMHCVLTFMNEQRLSTQ